jgi:hypothetical protein
MASTDNKRKKNEHKLGSCLAEFFSRPPSAGRRLRFRRLCNETKTVAVDVAVAQSGDVAHGMVVLDRRPWADANAPRVTYGPEGLDDYLGSTLTYSQVPPRANAAVKVVTVLTGVDTEGFREQLAFRFRKNAMRYFTKY